MKNILIFIWVILTVSCKLPSRLEPTESPRERSLAFLAYSTPESGPGNGALPLEFELDGKTGKPRHRLVLRLDYFPNEKSPQMGRQMPNCLEPLKKDLEIGFLICHRKEGSRVPLLAGMVDQVCYTQSPPTRVVGQDTVVLSGCSRATAILHQFEPQLRLDLETKDL
jgi:hypothetical protein